MAASLLQPALGSRYMVANIVHQALTMSKLARTTEAGRAGSSALHGLLLANPMAFEES